MSSNCRLMRPWKGGRMRVTKSLQNFPMFFISRLARFINVCILKMQSSSLILSFRVGFRVRVGVLG